MINKQKIKRNYIMKFPHELSKERLSLLSEEDKKIYDMEHSGLYNLEPKFVSNTNVIEEDAKIKRYMDQFLFESQFDDLFDKEIIEVVGEEEYMNIKKNLYEFIENDPEMQSELFEAPGHAADWWMDFKVSWIGKLAAGLLTGLIGLVAWLFMKGKDRLALKKLKQYMNKLVELIDMGVNKKRPWYSFLMLSKKNRQNTGDYNKACFRTIQETAERNMACLYTQCVHNLGFFNPGKTDFRGITSGMMPEEGSGLDNFSRVITGNVESLKDLQKANEEINLLPVVPDLKKFNTLKLPALPTNYTFLMCNIEYPAKADKNPNGSLFMKPTQEILQAKAEDLGLTYFSNFGNDSLDDIINWEEETPQQQAENASYSYALNNPYIQMLLEADEENKTDQESTALRKSSPDFNGGLLNNDTDPTEQIGGELNVHTEGKRTTKLNFFTGTILDAIDGYCRNSIPVVQKLVKAICGQVKSKNLDGFSPVISQLITAADGNMLDFMKKNDSVLVDIISDRYDKEIKKKTKFMQVQGKIIALQWLVSDKNPNKAKFVQEVLQSKGMNIQEYLAWLYEIIYDDKLVSDISALDDRIKEKFPTLTADKLINKYGSDEIKKQSKSSSWDDDMFDSFQVNINYDAINEEEAHKTSEEILSSLNKNLDTTYNNVRNFLTEKLSTAVDSDPKDWYIITSSRDRMNKLKEAADKEINEKIELICRLAGEGKTDIGDKFKSAISKHPMRAAGLKRIWAMYSDDLQDRIETRIRSITGDNGNSNILTTIKQFLLNVYPNLIATMLYYKQIFYLINLYSQRHPLKRPKQEDNDDEEYRVEPEAEFNVGNAILAGEDHQNSNQQNVS